MPRSGQPSEQPAEAPGIAAHEILALCIISFLILTVIANPLDSFASGRQEKGVHSVVDEPRDEMSPADREFADKLSKYVLDPLHNEAPDDALFRARNRRPPYVESNPHGGVESQLILWRGPINTAADEYKVTLVNRGADASLSVAFYGTVSAIGPKQANRQGIEDLRSHITKSAPLVNFGETPPADVLSMLLPIPTFSFLRRSAYSPNLTPEELLFAAGLGRKGVAPRSTVILNALPITSHWATGQIEIRRLGVRGTPEEWRSLDQELQQESINWDGYRRTNKTDILKELGYGNADVILLFAHGSSHRLYLPGIAGGSITMADLDQIKRSQAPPRVIVLLSCNASKREGDRPPLAEQMLKFRLAQTVFATDLPISARKIREILQQLAEGKHLDSSLPMLQQIVEDNLGTIFSGKGIYE
jgi:hypothetical protein